MNVIVDTCIWSFALRRKRPTQAEQCHVAELQSLIEEQRVVLLGPVRQEILSGIQDRSTADHLKVSLRAFEDFTLSTTDYERAGEFFTECRTHGIQGSNTDFLICAVAVNHQCAIYTTDTDFNHYHRRLPILLHKPAFRT